MKQDSISKEQFISVFNDLFNSSENTILEDSFDQEPVYLPARGHKPARIRFAHGFFSSALHEVAHWLHAGPRRREWLDYGYWYKGDSRDQQQQIEFEQVELVPQAYELILSDACGLDFRVSLDNFNPTVVLDRDRFTRQVYLKAQEKRQQGLPLRMQALLKGIRR